MLSTQLGEEEEVGEHAMAAPGQTIVLQMVLQVPTHKDTVLQVPRHKEIWSAGTAGNKGKHRPTAEKEQPEELHRYRNRNPSMRSPSSQ